MERLTTIRLYGKLGAKFGRVHRMAVQTPAEAVKALCVVLEGFEAYLINSSSEGMVFSVFRGDKNLSQDDLAVKAGNKDIRIAPIMQGAKKAGLFQTILGAVMVVAGVLITYFSGGTMSAFSASLIMSGAGMMAGGVYQMLSPQPKGLKGRQEAANTPSYAFGGAVNTTAMGNPVSVLYGTREIGGAIISAGIVAEDI